MTFTNFAEIFKFPHAASASAPPLVAHVVHSFAVGGLENGLVNLINGTPPDRYRHAVISLTDYTEFRHRLRRSDVPVIALHKRSGKDLRAHFRLGRLLRRMRPAIVHTRNLPAFEFAAVAALAGVPVRIHGEHGRDVYDLDGSNRKYRLLRKALNPFVSRYTAVSQDLARWLVARIGISADKVVRICNGVDTQKFRPRNCSRPAIGPDGFVRPETVVVGTVGRMQIVKDQLTLVRAFVHLIGTDPEARSRLRLVMIGDGPLREQSRTLLRAANAEGLAWVPGERDDIPEIMQAMDIFVLPSIAEGISNTILEAMATGLPVIATNVGGNPELVEHGRTGLLVPPSNPHAMADAIVVYLRNPDRVRVDGRAGRERVERHFSVESMIQAYLQLYDTILGRFFPYVPENSKDCGRLTLVS